MATQTTLIELQGDTYSVEAARLVAVTPDEAKLIRAALLNKADTWFRKCMRAQDSGKQVAAFYMSERYIDLSKRFKV